MSRKVVVTGLGALTPLGNNVPSFWSALIEGQSGIERLTRFDPSNLTTQIGGELKGFDGKQFLDPKELRRNDLYTVYAMVAADEAMRHAGLEDGPPNPERGGTIIGTGIGGITTFEHQHEIQLKRGPGRVSPFFIPMMIANMASGQVSIRWNLQGPNFTTVSACASGAHAIGESFEAIRRDRADIMIAGGAEATLTELCYAGFCAEKAMSTRNDDPQRASRPFDRERDGFVMGEGAGMLVLEEEEHAKKRGAHIYAELAGYGLSADAFHITAPSPEGAGAARAIRMALEDGEIAESEVGYINAHGTSTPMNDKIETAAVKSVFGQHTRSLSLGSTKSMTGHLLGAAGGIELVASTLAIHENVLPPTINHETPDPDCDLDCVPNTAREQSVSVVLSNSLGFGGHNVCLAVRRYS